jgi:molybdopterin biosynthesis enzyme
LPARRLNPGTASPTFKLSSLDGFSRLVVRKKAHVAMLLVLWFKQPTDRWTHRFIHSFIFILLLTGMDIPSSSSGDKNSRPLKRAKRSNDNKKMGQQQHPMVPVPDAIRVVLRETARVLLTPKAKPEPSFRISSDAPSSEIFGKVLDEDVRMEEPGYPSYNASIMDGYALRTSDYASSNRPPSDSSENTSWTHSVVDKVYAGDEQGPKSADGGTGGLPSAYYITTGAVIPETYDCVVPIEECLVSEDRQNIKIQPSAATEPNKWIRPIGCDIPAGSVVLPRGHEMDPVALGLLKQSGAPSISVKRRLVVGILSTGNELILGSKDDATQPGKIPDVNRPILLNLLSTFGNYCDPLDLGNERDDNVQAMARTIDGALEKCDVIITTGGISMGETDIMEHVLVEHCGGTLHFGRMHMKPGKSDD